MREIYETRISDGRWWVYDILGNAGWIAYFIALGLEWGKSFSRMTALAIVPAALMLVGIVELICERAAKLDRVLPRYRVLLGFGALTLGGVLGALAGLLGLFTAPDRHWAVMLAGGALCAVFAGLCYAGYKKKG